MSYFWGATGLEITSIQTATVSDDSDLWVGGFLGDFRKFLTHFAEVVVRDAPWVDGAPYPNNAVDRPIEFSRRLPYIFGRGIHFQFHSLKYFTRKPTVLH